MVLVMGFWTFLRAVFFGSAAVALENVALRHQLLVLPRSVGRPHLARWDRVFWVWLSRVWVSWRSSLAAWWKIRGSGLSKPTTADSTMK